MSFVQTGGLTLVSKSILWMEPERPETESCNLKHRVIFPLGKRLQLPSAGGFGGGHAAQVFRRSRPSQAVWWRRQTLPAAAPALGLQRRRAGLSSNVQTLYVD